MIRGYQVKPPEQRLMRGGTEYHGGCLWRMFPLNLVNYSIER